MNSVFCCFSYEKPTKSSQNPGLVNQFSATPRGQLNWTGPIANGSDNAAYTPDVVMPCGMKRTSEVSNDLKRFSGWLVHDKGPSEKRKGPSGPAVLGAAQVWRCSERGKSRRTLPHLKYYAVVNLLRIANLSRPDPCSVDFGRETPKF